MSTDTDDPGYDDFEYADVDAPDTGVRLRVGGTHEDRTTGACEASANACWADRISLAPDVWFTEAPLKRSWLLRDSRTSQSSGVLPMGKVGMLIGEGGVSKTMALVELALAVALGKAWLGAYQVEKAGRVLMILGEEDLDEVRRRCHNAARAMRVKTPDLGSLVVLPLSGVPCPMIEIDDRRNPVDAPFLLWLRSYVRENGPFSLIIVDPLSRFAGVDAEIDNAAATRFVQALESLATETGATVIVCHHTNKTSRGSGATVSGASARGSSAFYDGVRWVAALSAERIRCDDSETGARLGEVVTLTVVKSNYSAKGDPILLRRDPENGGALLPLDEVDIDTVASARSHDSAAAERRRKRDAEQIDRQARVAASVRGVLEAHPGVTFNGLLAAVRGNLGSCSRDVLEAALSNMRDLLIEPGPNNSLRHSLRQLPS